MSDIADQVQVTRTEVRGFRAWTVANQSLSFTIVPDLGGKVSSIRDPRSGREWLWTNPSLPYRRLPYGASYRELADTGGWDECFPTITACSYPLAPWLGLELPDHGELWSQAWSLAIEGDPAVGVKARMEVHGRDLPYVFHRVITIVPHDATLRFAYRVINMADRDLAFIWSAHPSFAVEPGMHVLLPSDARMRVWTCEPPDFIRGKGERGWPVHGHDAGDEYDLSLVPAATAGIACKLWSMPLARGYAALQAQDGAFRFTFDPAVLPQVGLWINAGSSSGQNVAPSYTVAIEPCIGAQDSLEQAVAEFGLYGLVPARGEHAWAFDAHLSVL